MKAKDWTILVLLAVGGFLAYLFLRKTTTPGAVGTNAATGGVLGLLFGQNAALGNSSGSTQYANIISASATATNGLVKSIGNLFGISSGTSTALTSLDTPPTTLDDNGAPYYLAAPTASPIQSTPNILPAITTPAPGVPLNSTDYSILQSDPLLDPITGSEFSPD